ncbi:anthranilate synthase component I [Candidatus Poribacteria bacterium]|nr:anthranilate synthase component I [Candidatus Poribacteria bacterium]
MYTPTLDEFRRKASEGTLIPVFREVIADLETPVSAFLKIDDGSHAFLLESVEGGEHLARYSFLGTRPSLIFSSRGNEVRLSHPATGKQTAKVVADPFAELEAIMSRYRPVPVEGLPRFHGGMVGYLSYDMVRFFERLPDTTDDDAHLPDAVFLLTDTILVFDHVRHRIQIVSNAHLDEDADVDAAYAEAVARIDDIADRLRKPLAVEPCGVASGELAPEANMPREQYEDSVRRAKEYIHDGDIIQAVLSQRYTVRMATDPFTFYRALRVVNPSPYMYFLNLGDLQIAGASPEMLVRVEDGVVETRPIAGTRRRGASSQEDDELAAELLADPKERAEHVMLVDLGRNDLGRVCEAGSVHVPAFMTIEKYSHVMHIVSYVVGRLSQGKTSFDVIRSAFPAGTLSGAPKIRAMEIIDELEPTRRGPYGGAVGYFSFGGNADTAITIRTLVVHGGCASVQVGAGIVADSVPELEHTECRNKAGAVMRALELAYAGLEAR